MIAFLLAGVAAHALEPTTPLAGYGRQSWVMENGLPQNTVQALVQTHNGYVWLGTEMGLVRFDGNGFEVFDRTSNPALPGNDVRCLLVDGDGALWIGTSEGLARWKDGAVKVFTTKDGLPGNNIKSLVLNSDGSIRIDTPEGGASYKDDRFSAVDVVCYLCPFDLGRVDLPNGRWAGATATALVIGRGDKNIEAQLTIGRELPGNKIQKLLADREGALWIGTNAGLVRWYQGKLQKPLITDPLFSESILAIFEDREGNLWVGTERGGLHILRDQRFKALTVHDGLSSDNTTTVVQDSAGALWVGTSGGGLNVVRPAAAGSAGEGGKLAINTLTAHDGLPSDVILSLASGLDGDMWVGTPDGLSRVRGRVVTTFTSADGLPDDFIRSLLVDTDGSLWVGTRRGLTHWLRPGSGSAMETYTQSDGLGSDLVGAMVRDSAGDLWVATLAGLSRLHDGKITNFTTADGLSSNVITALLPQDSGALLVGTQDHGWMEWNGRRFFAPKQPEARSASIRAILYVPPAYLWFATGDGILRCDLSAATRSLHDADCGPLYHFGTADGLSSRETAINSHPSAWVAKDGRLWFATPKGLASVDSAHFPINSVPPPVAIVRFAADDREQALDAAGDSITVPAGHNHFQFDYAGLSFVAPQKVRYRFMLEGFDHNWTEAGSRRIAYYTNIPPGHYTFRVQAANNDGDWNMEGTALAFELRPHFYQTVWFYALLALFMAGLIVLLLRLRLMRAEREFRAVLGERARIAREIHDTLAQGYVGISVQLEVLSELLRHNKVDAASRHLDKTRGYVREGLADARQSIWSLRSQDSSETTLPVQIQRMVEHAGGHGLEAKFSLYGAYHAMPPGTEREILRVAQEAIHNVKKHAEASSLMVQLHYGVAELALEVRDNGRGFETVNGKAPDTATGHYGMTGMQERAAVIGGTLEVTSEPGAGTTVRLRTPVPREIKE